jgi:hypothetical protein
MILAANAPKGVAMRGNASARLGDLLAFARATLLDVARGLRETMYAVVDCCGATASWD